MLSADLNVMVDGQPWTELPVDLYVPPDALRILLEAFEGPLDVLLYLIRKQKFDILDIPVAVITQQYMRFIDLMRVMNIELAGEYLLMAAILAEIKSRLLLPRPTSSPEEEALDPRADLMRRLQEYERYKQAASDLDQLPLVERDTYVAMATLPPTPVESVRPMIPLPDLVEALRQVFERAHLSQEYAITPETLSIRERMSLVLSAVNPDRWMHFNQLFTKEEGRMGIVVSLIAILELIRQSVLELIQEYPFNTIQIRAKK